MLNTFSRSMRTVVVILTAVMIPVSAGANPGESKRLIQARDYIGDERWALAIEQLRAAIEDPKETRRDEAMYWLAHSQHHSGDPGSAIRTINRLEKEFPSSMWVRPAQSLRIEIAVRLQRTDVLWWTALPAVAATGAEPSRATRKAGEAKPRVAPPKPARPPVEIAVVPAPPVPPPPAVWQVISPDDDLRIQAMGGLLRFDDAEKVVPLLGQIAFESGNPGPATRALFMLAQSPLPEARETVVRAAKTASDPMRIAAVSYLARFGGPEVSKDLLTVYGTANEPVKLQVLESLGERSEKSALWSIVKVEKNSQLRSKALLSLGRAGEAQQLATMYRAEALEGKRSIIVGLFLARGDAQLMQIADIERKGNPELWRDALERLRLLGTPKARAYLQKVNETR